MSIEDHLTELKTKIDKELEIFLDNKIKQIKEQRKPKELLQMTENLKDFVLRSGKRIRPILFYCGYLIAGGKSKKEILKASVSVEFIHSYLLIHDDIIDRDSFRHGGLSMHYKYEKDYVKKVHRKNLKHFGASMAIMAGNLSSVYGFEALAESRGPIELKMKAIGKLNEILSNTVAGEALDIVLSVNGNFGDDAISEMQKYKTAKYTIEGPLHMGAIIGGANDEFLKSISKFAIPLGIAFQIQDDIIGIFGSEQKIGKPVGSDIKEGKKTLLISKAIEWADNKQKEKLTKLLGNTEINLKEIEEVRKIIKETGSFEYSQNTANRLIEISKKHLDKMKIPPRHKKFLNELSDFIVKREH